MPSLMVHKELTKFERHDLELKLLFFYEKNLGKEFDLIDLKSLDLKNLSIIFIYLKWSLRIVKLIDSKKKFKKQWNPYKNSFKFQYN